jgi:hypothetical protein
VIVKIDKTVYKCTCELKVCGGSWESDGDKVPDRCRWCGSRNWNRQDKRKKRLITAKGKTRRISEWAKETGISIRAIRGRLRLGWSDEDAVTVPIGKMQRYKESAKKVRNE